MHPAAHQYIVKQLLTIGISNKRLLEIGSLDVNSSEQGLSLRALCESAADYIGIDEQIGLGVDVVVSACDYNGKGRFDLVISTEALEHTPHPEEIIECAWRALKPGGALLLTAAGPERQPHNCDGTAWAGAEHYANINPDQLSVWLADWEVAEVLHNPGAGDVYARAVKPKKGRS
jgi:SAM-dependent methyltransferase